MTYSITWTPQTGSPSLISGACSDDGVKAIAISSDVSSIKPYITLDSGATWSVTHSALPRRQACCSGDFQYVFLVRAASGVAIERSTDFGATFNNVGPLHNYTDICCSNSGQIVYAVYASGKIQKSTDYGVNWSELSGSSAMLWRHIACSDDGTYIIASGENSPYLYISNDSGATWSSVSAGLAAYGKVAISGSGQYQYAVGTVSTNLTFFKSSDYGATWSSNNIYASVAGFSITCSNNGKYVVVSPQNGTVLHSSDDYGETFNLNGIATYSTLYDVISNDSGGLLYAFGTSPIRTGTAVIVPDFLVTSITPNIGSTAGGTPVTITGTAFDPAATAAIGGNELTDLTVVDSTTITGVTPAGTVGAKDVVVTNP